MKIFKLSYLVLFSFFVGSLSLVQAADPIGLKISPLIIHNKIAPGESGTSVIQVTNPYKEEIEVTTEIEDFLTDNEEGIPQFFPEGSGQYSLASWIEVEESFTMESEEIREVLFEVAVPNNAEPGGHFASILFRAKSTTLEEGQISVSGRLGALVLVEVSGDISKKGELLDFTAPTFINKGPVNFMVRFKNLGNTHYQPEGKIEIYNWFGKKTDELKLSKHFILPDSIYQYDEFWQKRFLLGNYRAVLEIQDGEGGVYTKEVKFTAFPWQELLLIIGLIILIIVIFKVKKKKGLILKR